MPRINEMIESKFLKKEDVDNDGRGALVTIANVAQHNVAMQGAGEEYKWCLEFEEVEKPMVLNTTNMRIIEKITNSDNTDGWIGQKIVLYMDPNISFGGKIVGGIRVRAPRLPQQQAVTAPRIPAPVEEIPF